MQLHTRCLESGETREVYITALPSAGAPAAAAAEEMFTAVADTLRPLGARIFQERVFGTPQALEELAPVRAAAYGPLADEVPPAWLLSPRGVHEEIAGIQVHAVCGAGQPAVLRSPRGARGRVLSAGGATYIALTGLTAPEAGAETAQARAFFEEAEALLEQAGTDIHSIARTWVWLGDILPWYGDFNRVRTQFYTERGLIGPAGAKLPASTGIGIRPMGRAACALDVMAIIGPKPQHWLAGGNQDSAFKYGSAFSRGSKVRTPGGDTVYVSGTASIDSCGATEHVGDTAAQIEATITNVRAVLRDLGCGDADVVQSLAYCKTPEIEQAWSGMRSDVSWPMITTVADVCRDDLLFEVEATACVGAR